MHEALFSPYIVPLGAFAVAIAFGGFAAWRKVREHELRHEFELRQKEMEHQQKMKEMDLEMARLKDGKA